MKKNICLRLSLILALFGLPLSGQDRDNFVKEYKIGPKDLLEIKVLEVPELANISVRVSEDGTITLPLIENIKIAGLTKDDAAKALAKALEKWVKNPQVSIFIKEYQSQKVSVIGAVNSPGAFELVGRVTLLEIIGQAGGFKETAANDIYILRQGNADGGASIKIDIEELTIKGDKNLNIPLQPGDLINVPVDKIITIFVFGAVKSPGALQVKMSKNVNILQAIAQAGGVNNSGSNRGVTIKRPGKDGKDANIIVNLNDIIKGKKPNIALKEGDVVFVKESIF